MKGVSLRDPVILIAASLTAIVVFYAVAPIASFYAVYSKALHGVGDGARMSYLMSLRVCRGERVNATIAAVLNITFHDGLADYEVVVFRVSGLRLRARSLTLLNASLLCTARGRTEGPPLLYLVTPKGYDEIRVAGDVYARDPRFWGYTVNPFNGRPSSLYGYAALYTWTLIINNASCDMRRGCVFVTVEGERYNVLSDLHVNWRALDLHVKPRSIVLDTLSELHVECNALKSLEDGVERGELSVCVDDVSLYDANFYPRQHLLYGLYASFLSLFPLNLLLIGTAVILVAARVRGWL